MPIFALNLFEVCNREEYLKYARGSVNAIKAHQGRVVALGKYRQTVAGDLLPRTVFILVEWASKEAFDGYCNDQQLSELHSHRENGTSGYIWQLFDKLDNLRPLLK